MQTRFKQQHKNVNGSVFTASAELTAQPARKFRTTDASTCTEVNASDCSVHTDTSLSAAASTQTIRPALTSPGSMWVVKACGFAALVVFVATILVVGVALNFERTGPPASSLLQCGSTICSNAYIHSVETMKGINYLYYNPQASSAFLQGCDYTWWYHAVHLLHAVEDIFAGVVAAMSNA